MTATKFKIERNELLICLQRVMGAVEKRNTMPALAHVLCEVDANRLAVTGTDLEIMLRTRSDQGNGDTFSTLLPGRKLLDICKSLADGAAITLTKEDGRVTVASGRSRFSLACLSAVDFPILETSSEAVAVTLATKEFSAVLAHTAFAMANQDVRYYLNGLLIKVEPALLTVVATDGHRLSINQIDGQFDVGEAHQVIVPRKGVLELQKLLPELSEEVTLQLTPQHVRVESPTIEFTSKLIDARFPDYERVIPIDLPHRLTVEKKLLKDALQRVSILSNERYRGVRLALCDNQAKLEANNTEQEQAEETLLVDYQGESMEVGFNVHYLLDVLNVVEADEVIIDLKDPSSSILVSDPAAKGSRYVIMPMRL
ncbi:MAG: DNA polymerase III subunit beta [Thiotrichales bacterium]